MDSLVYNYQLNRNRLTHVDDPGGVAGNHSYDVDDQQADNYTYDATGNLTSDAQEGITSITWTPSNKIRSITKGTSSKLEYTYDGAGNRVVKRFYQPANTLKSTTWYARDAQGNVLSIYERPSPASAITQTEVHIYGSSRIGIEQRSITYSTSPFAWLGSEQHRDAGTKRYELTDHLGNVRVTVSDLLVDRPTGFGYATQDAEVLDRRDYYPFGMEMPGRRWRATGEEAGRFGFNGKENDNEVKGEGNQQDYGFRIYDPRVARFLSVDPLAGEYAELTPYQFASDQPIWAIDLDGLERYVVTFRTFIPEREVSNPSIVGPARFAGDNRESYKLYTDAYRTEQKLSVDFEKGIVRALNNTASATHGWDSKGNEVTPSSPDYAGKMSYGGFDMADQNGLIRKEVPMSSSDQNALSASLSLTVNASNKLLSVAPAIDAELNLRINACRDGSFSFSLNGKKDGFPAYELWIKDQNSGASFLLFGSNPGANKKNTLDLFPPMDEVVSVKGERGASSRSETVVPFEQETNSSER